MPPPRPNWTPSSSPSTPAGTSPTTGPATSRACGRRGSTTTSAPRPRPRPPCGDHRRRPLRRRTGGRARQRRPRGPLVVVRVGGHGHLPGHSGHRPTWLWPARCSRTIVVDLPDGNRLTMHAPGASASSPYIHFLTVTGVDPARALGSVLRGSAARSRRPAARELDRALAAGIGPTNRRRVDLRARRGARSGVGNRSGVESALLRRRSAPGGGLLGAQRRHHRTGRSGRHRTAGRGLGGSTGDRRSRGVRPAPDSRCHPPSGRLVLGAAATRGPRSARSGCPTPARSSQNVTITASTTGPHLVTVRMTDSHGDQLPPVMIELAVTP